MNITYEAYARALSAQLIPLSVVGTSTSKDGPYFAGLQRELSHNHWLIKTEDETKVRDAIKYVNFDISVDFRNVRLGALSNLHDALTKRLLCLELIKHNATARTANANHIIKLLNLFDLYTRWRLGRNISCNSRVKLIDFKAYKAITKNDVTHLLPLESRLDALVADNRFVFPIYAHGKRFRLDWAEFSDELGANHLSLGRSKSFRDALASRVPSLLRNTGVNTEILDLYVRGTTPAPAQEINDQATRMYVWDALDRMSAKGLLEHDALSFRVPATPTRKLKVKRTQSLLPYDFMRVLELAANWVVLYSDFILAAVEARSELPKRPVLNSSPLILDLMKRTNHARPTGLPELNLGLSATFPAPPDSLRLSKALAYLYLSCAILIAGFEGRRVNEVRYLRENCIQSGSVPKLSIYIEKTLRDVDAIPVPEAVVCAVRLLETMSSEARVRASDKWLFQYYHTFADGQQLEADTRFAPLLNEFFRVAKLEPPQGTSTWNMKFHMLRKGFAISFYHGNLWGSFDGANRMLRHTSAGMTGIYMDDEDTGALGWLRSEVGRLAKRALTELSAEEAEYFRNAKAAFSEHKQRKAIWDGVRQEFFVGRMMEIFDGEERPTGKGAARMLDLLIEMERQALARIHFSAVPTNSLEGVRDDVLTQVKKAAADHFMEPVPGGLMYCGFKRGSNEHAAIANCLVGRSDSVTPWQRYNSDGADNRPDYAFSGLYPCLGCEFCLMLNKNQKDIANVVDTVKREIPNAASAQLAESANAYLDDILVLIVEAERVVDGKQRPR